MLGGQNLERVDLVVEYRRGEVAADLSLEGRTSPRRTAAVGDDHCESLVGEPLRRVEQPSGTLHSLGVRAAVGIQQHRQRGGAIMPGRKHQRSGERSFAERVEADVEIPGRLLAVVAEGGDHSFASHDLTDAPSVHVGPREHPHVAADHDTAHPFAVGHR